MFFVYLCLNFKILIQMDNLSKIVAGFLATSIGLVVSGFVLTKLWFWFVVPTFGFTPLGIVESIGVVILVSFLKSAKRDESVDLDNFWKQLIDKLLFSIYASLAFLFFGWAVSLFM